MNCATPPMNIVEWMVSEKIATNGFSAAHIAEGLKLWKVFDRKEQERMCLLYRKWRTRTDKKNDIPSSQAYDLAIAGIDPDDVQPRQIEMIDMLNPDLSTIDWSGKTIGPNHG